jgi:anti-sigma factor RsiW
VALIGRYVSSDLNVKELAAFERHLAACRDCVAFLQTYKKTVQLTRNFLALGRGAKPLLARTSPDRTAQPARRNSS